MSDSLPKFVAAAVQAAPVYLDREATVDKACDLIHEAGVAGARLIVFPETWIPMYPFWHTTPDVGSGELFARLWKNAVELPSASTRRLAAAARGAKAWVVVGINERDQRTRGTLYNTMAYFSPDGAIAHTHRKLMPTFTERTIWGMGDGSDLQVLDTPLGRIGGLICWEHEMTLAKFALYAQGEQVHCSQWPAYSGQNEHIDFGVRQYAFEGACFVVSACGVVVPGALPRGIGVDGVGANGGSAIVAPNGRYLAGPVYDKEEIVYAEIDLEDGIREKHSHDVAGHYARPDVFQLVMNTRPKTVARLASNEEARMRPVRTDASEEDRLEVVREYLGSLAEQLKTNGDAASRRALAEALASIESVAQGVREHSA
jgi:nitrilase